MRRSSLILVCILLLIVLVLPGCEPYKIQPINVSPPINQKNGWQINTSSQVINDLLTDGSVLWLATEGGVIRWEPNADVYWKYTTIDGLASNTVSCLLKAADGSFWFGTSNGISQYDGTTWHSWLQGKPITNIVQDKSGNIWVIWVSFTSSQGAPDVICSESVIECFYGTEWQTVTLGEVWTNGNINSIFCDDQDNLWFGSSNGLYKYDGKTWCTYTTDDGLPYNYIVPFVQDKRGNIWFRSSVGAIRYDGRRWRTFTEGDGLGSNTVVDIAVDIKGKIWFSHGNYGITCYNGKSWRYFTKNDGLPTDYIANLAADDSAHIWFSIYERDINNVLCVTGLGFYSGYDWQVSPYSRGLASNIITAIATDTYGNV
jgi:ligand-binding sensor domain-containing protein